MSEPIGLEMLVHSATLTPKGTGSYDAYGNPIPGTPVELSQIRVSRAKQTLMTSMGEAKNDKLTLIFDCVNSLPAGTTFTHGDKVTYKGTTYIVREATDSSGDEEGPHHWRVALVGS